MRAENAPDAVAHRALADEGGKGVFQDAGGGERRVGQGALLVRAVLERGAQRVIGVGQQPGAEEDPALAAGVHGAQREAAPRADGHGRVRHHAHAAVEALQLGELGVGLVERVKVARYVLYVLQVPADLGVFHVIGVLVHLTEALRAEKFGREEVIEAVGEIDRAAVLRVRDDIVAQRSGVGGGHYALVGVEDVVSGEVVSAGNVHRLGVKAQQQGLLETGEGVLPGQGICPAVIEHGGAQAVFPAGNLGLGQVVLPHACAAGEQRYDERAHECERRKPFHGAPPEILRRLRGAQCLYAQAAVTFILPRLACHCNALVMDDAAW